VFNRGNGLYITMFKLTPENILGVKSTENL
jgi:hypothetical protein